MVKMGKDMRMPNRKRGLGVKDWKLLEHSSKNGGGECYGKEELEVYNSHCQISEYGITERFLLVEGHLLNLHWERTWAIVSGSDLQKSGEWS